MEEGGGREVEGRIRRSPCTQVAGRPDRVGADEDEDR